MLGLLFTNAAAWDRLSSEDHQLLARSAAPFGPLFIWFEMQFHEHGAQSWAVLREALRGHPHESAVIAEVDYVLLGANPETENELLDGAIDQLRSEELKRESHALSVSAATDRTALERLRAVNARLLEVNERIKARSASHPV